ncbi:unnamed protein product [Closterium sp. Naga37s-1]|nr:unnamed protein product [Closterium sp. Naga37s-1]
MGRTVTPRRALARTQSPKPSRTTGGPGVDMEPLVLALGDSDVERAREAASAIRSSLKNNPDNKARLLAAGGVDALIRLLKSRDTSCVDHAVTALLNLSLTDGVEPLVTAAGGIEGIVGVLNSGSNVARENAAAALFTLSGPADNKLRVKDAGAVPGLVSLLRTGSLRGKKDAALALFNLSLEDSCIGEIIDAGTVRVLMGLLRGDADAGMEDKVMAVVANLCKFSEGRHAVHKEGGIHALLGVIESGSARAKEDAAVSLHLLAAHNAASFQAIADEDCSPALSKLAQSGTTRAKSKAKALMDLVRSGSGSGFKYGGSFSQPFDKSPPAVTGELSHRRRREGGGIVGRVRMLEAGGCGMLKGRYRMCAPEGAELKHVGGHGLVGSVVTRWRIELLCGGPQRTGTQEWLM